ncbi:hypothetical protein F503_00888 [Ophiostoma piceae UAMH 11346]|uniref:Uncharacterized protein n=1 Tax=Ophiostoma piceae (strain UAMH 11346) TaxID=1262450 RepID=S3D403_OPHP1|nr:hypothetical protein F503_00888 [Ophiostoma piceae UAMH 11346]
MVVQKAILADDSSSTASIDLTTTTTTTTITATLSTDGAPPSDPLYMPIQVPGPFFPYADSINTTAAAQLQMVMEEASISALIHAACRLYEATAVATNAFEKLIFRWTGLAPQEAATAALIYELPKKDPPNDISMDLLQQQRGMMLQTLLKATQLLATATGIMAGMTIDARALAVSHELLLPLSAFESEDVAATFSAFTGGATLATAKKGMDDLEQSLSDMALPLHHALWGPARFKMNAFYSFKDRRNREHGREHTTCGGARLLNYTMAAAIIAHRGIAGGAGVRPANEDCRRR